MGKFFIFSLLFWITGNPFVALLVIFLILYLLDLRFVKLMPNLFRPIKQSNRLRRIMQDIRLNPHDTSSKLEAARILMEKRRYGEAKQYLDEISKVMKDSAEFLSDYGILHIKMGDKVEGEALLKQALHLNPRVKYGEPFLYLSEVYAEKDTSKAMNFLTELQKLNSSSAEVCYRMGLLFAQMGQKEEAKQAYNEAIEVYRGLPKYKKRMERRWALLSRFKMSSL
ncbi:tetratricopeptide repeat protein [Brevibacillus daliensis]|uniref:tetratricopeptide repeat protein n=1 Tax=Brevibacillus daliensis TaxID=2892995 RepID=UPI001E527239|nr:tetratricopeptide repeat protein [Brevibacillus daliensis]